MLPTTKTERIVDLNKQVILFYGTPKIGKSTIASKFDKPLFLATEPGLNHLDVFKVPINSWTKFLDTCQEIANGRHEFKNIAVDTVDNLLMYCTEYVCAREKINHPSDYDYGKGWSMVSKEFKRAMSKLALLPYGLIMVSHAKLEEVKTKSKSYNKMTLSVTGENRKVILAMADIILYITQEENEGVESRVMHASPSLYHEAGDRSSLLPSKLPLSYEELSKYFKGGDV